MFEPVFTGYIHFWNIYDSSGPMGRFLAVSNLPSSCKFCACTHKVILFLMLILIRLCIQSQSGCVTALSVDSGNTVLVSADADGMGSYT